MAMVKREKEGKFWINWRVILFIYGIIPTLQPSNFGRVYAAYGRIFVVMAFIWGLLIDKKRPDRYEVIGGTIVLIGAAVIFYAPR
jgi:small multidrug resistance family-3 protein